MTTQQLLEKAEAATPGPWHHDGHGGVDFNYHLENGDEVIDCICSCEVAMGESPNAEFIAAANPETILALLDQLEAAQKDADAAWASLPGTTYMDSPDGGSPMLAEMLGRMAKDAERYRGLRARTKIFEQYFGCEYEEIDTMVDAALNPAREDG